MELKSMSTMDESVVRRARVLTLDPIPTQHTFSDDPVDEALEKITFSTKVLVGVFLFTVLLMMGIWASWNLKNALHIDLRRGRHHELIDEVNDAFGI